MRIPTLQSDRARKISETRKRLYAEGKLVAEKKERPPKVPYVMTKEHCKRISETRKRLYAEGELSRRSPNKIRVIPETNLDEGFGNWLAGFSDGEACFSIAKLSGSHGGLQPIFRVTLRRDDTEILLEVQKRLGFGNIGYAKAKTERKDGTVQITQTVSFAVTTCAHCMALVNVFTRFSLRAKKRLDFDLWKQLVQICFEQDGAKYAEHHILVDALQKGKKFKRATLRSYLVETK